MFRIAKNAAGALALTGLVLSQPALAVRSSESLPSVGAKVSGTVGRVASTTEKSEDFAGIPTIGLILGLAVLVAIIAVVASDNNNNNVSPG